MAQTQVAWTERNLTNIVKAVNSKECPEVMVKLRLQQHTIGRPEAKVEIAAQCVKAFDVSSTQRRLEVKWHHLAVTYIRRCHEAIEGKLPETALAARSRFAQCALPSWKGQALNAPADVERSRGEAVHSIERVGPRIQINEVFVGAPNFGALPGLSRVGSSMHVEIGFVVHERRLE